MFCKNFWAKQLFCGLWHVLKPLSHADVTMRQLDTPVKAYGCSEYIVSRV